MWTLMLLLRTLSLFGVARGDVLITYPKGGELLDFSAENIYNVTWMESNIVPLIEDLGEYTMVLYAGTNENFTEMATMDPRNFTDSTAASDLFYFQNQSAVPNSRNDVYFLGIVSTLKANTSIQIINFSNRFSISGMDKSLSFHPTLADQGIAPPEKYFECSAQLCNPSTALVNLSTPTGPPITAIPTSEASSSGSGSGDVAFTVGAATTGAIGGIFTLSCIFIFVTCYRRSKPTTESNTRFRKQPSVKWWNKLPMPKFGASELPAGSPQYDTVELPGEDENSIYELPAESIRRGIEGNRKMNEVPEVKECYGGVTEIGVGIQRPNDFTGNLAGQQRATRDIVAAESETSDEPPARETTAMLPKMSPDLSRSQSTPSNGRRTTPRLPARGTPGGPSIRASAPQLSQAELKVLAGAVAPPLPSKPKGQCVYK